MNFEHTPLPAALIADLYKHSLVVVEGEVLTAQRSPAGIPAVPDPVPAPTQLVAAVLPEPASTAPLAVPEPAATPVIQYLGGFRQQVSIVIREAGQPYISEGDLAFLQKLMGACKLAMDDLAVINVEANQPAAAQLWQWMPAKAVLMFGVGTSEIGIPFFRPDFQVQHWNNAVFMSAPALSAFQGPDSPQQKALKRELWEGLQKMFLGK